ncbi:hypothetical protein TI03_01920 [Achromatium sp. WMS1]|nr:hypothetical protein TI03_01920 [Achromatium sp. WMS1]
MLRCPNCRAQKPGTQQCRRCGIDLTALQKIEDTAKCFILKAIQALASQNQQALADARNALLAACALQQDPLTTLLLNFSNHAHANHENEGIANYSQNEEH